MAKLNNLHSLYNEKKPLAGGIIKGMIFGSLVYSALYNAEFAILSGVAFISLSQFSTKIEEKKLIFCFAIFAAIVWMFSVQIICAYPSFRAFLQIVLPFGMILVFFFVKVDRSFLLGFAFIAYLVFLLDFGFNLSNLMRGSDLLGRVGFEMRPDDVHPRLGGIMMHSFQSVNITLVATFFSLALGNLAIFFLGIIGLLINGTLRAPLAVVLVLSLWAVCLARPLLNAKLIKAILLIAPITFVMVIFAGTIYLAEKGDAITGNHLRVYAWEIAARNIENSPILGGALYQDIFLEEVDKVEMSEGMDEEKIRRWGVHESTFLEIWSRFGVFPTITIVLFLLWIVWTNGSSLILYSRNRLFLGRAVMSGFCLADIFFGSFYGSVIPMFSFCLLCISQLRVHA